MEFRVTVGLGQDSADAGVLDGRATALQRRVPADAQVLVDVVKAALQVVVALDVHDAVEAVQQAARITADALREAELDRPTSVVTVEAEAVAVPDADLRPHPAP